DALQGRQICRVVAQALDEPGAEDAMSQTVHSEALAALVGQTAQRLLQDQAGVGVESAGAAAENVARQLEVIRGCILTPQTQTESAAAAGQTVAAAGVAAAHA